MYGVSRMVRLWIEFVGLYVALPVALLVLRQACGAFPVLPVLWVAAYPAARFLVLRQGWGAKELVGLRLTRGQVGRMAARLAAAAAVLAGGILLVAPAQWLELPRRDLGLWALVMALYPVLSVFPQGILYRGLYYARYAVLFRGERAQLLAGAAAFSLAHLIFANAWAVLLTLAGGLLINRTYRKTGSLMAANLEHAAYGQLVFTCGWGRFLYHGITRLVEGSIQFS